VERRGGIFDHDLDAQPRRPNLVPSDPVDKYQRLVANPFLTVLAWIVLLGLLRGIPRGQEAAGLAAGMVVFVMALLLIQFHCLDCGATGWLLRRHHHVCPKVMRRWQNQIVRRFHGPGLGLQLVGWFIIMLAALVLGLVALEASR
jgi:hypothetical protein